MKKYIIGLCIIIISVQGSFSQEWKLKDKLAFSGYLTDMGSLIYQKSVNEKTWDFLLHNRINIEFFPTESLTASIQFRTRLMSGQTIKNDPDIYADYIGLDLGKMDLSFNLLKKKKYLLNTSIDRLYLDYTINNFQLTIGRQRINWGKTFAWNPNDLFNAYSFFDFDYTEKPGSDAIRAQLYTGVASSFELAVKIDYNDKVTAATMYRFNKFNYDFQVLAGMVNEEDFVIGGGWSGNIKNISFRGELSWLRPEKNFSDTSGVFISTVSLGYIFTNNLSIQLEGLYNQNADNSNITSFQDYYGMDMSVKTLSFTKYSLFAQLAYPLTPLMSLNFSTMYYPEIDGFFMGPSLSYSIKNNLDLSVFSQIFAGEIQEGIKETYVLGFLRLKGSF
ncbi:hypothetical protein ACFLRG_02090 [Bacteroidota bacterium]